MTFKSTVVLAIPLIAFTVLLCALLWRQSETIDQTNLLISQMEELLEEGSPDPRPQAASGPGVIVRTGNEISDEALEALADRLLTEIQSSCAAPVVTEGDSQHKQDSEEEGSLPQERAVTLQEMAEFTRDLLDSGNLRVSDVMELRQMAEKIGIRGRPQMDALKLSITDAINAGELEVEDPAFIVF